MDSTIPPLQILLLLASMKFAPVKAQLSVIEDVRLSGGLTPAEGRVEIFVLGEWGTICDDGWDINDANVICRQLGFESAVEAPRSALHGEGTGRIWLDDVECKGNERTILNCSSWILGIHNCDHSEDAGVKCLLKTVIEALRLSGGSTSAEGRVEVFIHGQWGTICGDDWDINDAHVVCRQLGFDSAIDAPNNIFMGEGTGLIWLDNVQCTGNEETISNCTSRQLSDRSCFHRGNAGVRCLVTVKIDEIILTRGVKREEGMVKISIDDVWGALCDDDHWGVANSYVVCRQLGYDSAVTLQKEFSSLQKTDRPWKYYFRCSGDEKRLDDCFTGIYENNYTCNSSLVYVVCLSHSTGTVPTQMEHTTVSHSWIYIVGIILLVIAIFMYVALKRFNLDCYAKTSTNEMHEKSIPVGVQRPLPSATVLLDQKYETIDNAILCHAGTSEKSAPELYDNNSYELMLGSDGEHVPEKREDLDSTYHAYSKTIYS